MAIITETLRPSSIVSISNFTPNDVTYIQDDPSSPDSNNLVPVNATSNPTVDVKFDSPSGTFTGTQTIRLYSVDPNWISLHIEVFDNGVNVFTSAAFYPGAGRVDEITFDSSILTDTTGANVFIRVVGHIYNGQTIQSLNAMSWVANVEEGVIEPDPEPTPQTFSTSFDEYTVGAFPSDWTEIWATGTDSTWRVTNEATATDEIVLQHTATADGRRIITWNDVGTISGDFDILVKWKTSLAIDGDIPTRVMAYASGTTQATQNAYQLDALFPSTLRIGKTLNGSYSTLSSNVSLPFVIDNNLWYWYRFRKVGSTLYGKIWQVETEEPIDFMVMVDDTTITSGSVGLGAYDYTGEREFDSFSVGIDGATIASPTVETPTNTIVPIEGAINATSSASASLSKSVNVIGSIEATSTLDVTVTINRSINGTISSSSSLEATLQKEISLNGAIEALSTFEGIIDETEGLFGSIQALSQVEANTTIERSISGAIQAESLLSSTTLEKEVSLNGSINATTTINADFTIEGVVILNGNINALSSLNAYSSILRSLEAHVEAISLLDTTTLEKLVPLESDIQAISYLESTLVKDISLQGNIKGTSTLLGDTELTGELALRANIHATSTINASLQASRALESHLEANAALTSNLSLKKRISGNIEAFSSLTSDLTRIVPLEALVSSISTINGEVVVLNTIYLNGQIQGISTVSSNDIQLTMSLNGMIEEIATLSDVLFVEAFLESTINSYSSIESSLTLNRSLEGAIQAQSLIYEHEPIDTLIEVDSVLYSGVSTEDDGKLLSYTIDSGVGRRIEFIFEFKVEPTDLQKVDFRVEGTIEQPFTLRAFNYITGDWDVATNVIYDGRTEEQFVSLVISNTQPYLDTNNVLRIRMLSLNQFSSGALTLSTDYAELIKTYAV